MVLLNITHNTFHVETGTPGHYPQTVYTYQNFAPNPHSVLICAWVPDPLVGDNEVAEIWRYSLPPNEHFQCIGLQETIEELDASFHNVVALDEHRLLFLGSDELGGGGQEWDVSVEINF